MKNSKTVGHFRVSSLRRASGDTAAGYSVMKLADAAYVCSFFENCRDQHGPVPSSSSVRCDDVYRNRTFQRGQFFCFHIVRVFQDGFNHGHVRANG